MLRNLLWCILGTQARERRLGTGRCDRLPPCPLTPRRRPGHATPSRAQREERPVPRDGGGEKHQDNLHHTTLTTTTRLKGSPRHTRGRNGFESLIAIHSCHHTIRGRRAGWAGTREGPEPDPAHHSPRITPFMDGGPAEVHPGLQGPRSRLSHAQSKGHLTLAH